MAHGKVISWPYLAQPVTKKPLFPCLGIRLRTASGKEYPTGKEQLVWIDTGFSGEILLPESLYEALDLSMWEDPDPDPFIQFDGQTIDLIGAQGFILIPKLSSSPFPIKVHVDDRVPGMVIGAGFIKRFKLLLDGPEAKVCIL